MSELWQRGREPLRGFRVLRLGLNPERSLLYERINQRARRMFDQGLVEETRNLLARYAASASPDANRDPARRLRPTNGTSALVGDTPAALVDPAIARRRSCSAGS